MLKEKVETKTVKSEDLQDRFHKIPVQPARGVLTIDASKTERDRIEEMLNLRLRFGKNHFYSIVQEAEKYAEMAELKQKEENEQRQKESEAKKKLYSDPLSKFIKTNRNPDPTFLFEFLRNEPTESLQSLANELEGKPRHYASLFENIAEAIQTLKLELAKRQTAPPDPQASLLKRIKQKIGK